MVTALATTHVPEVARLHRDALTGLLADLGGPAIQTFYLGAIPSVVAVGLVALDGTSVRGFVFGSTSPPTLRHDVVVNHRVAMVLSLGTGILRRPQLIASVLRSLWPPSNPGYNPDAPELTYLAVAQSARRARLGEQLVTAFGDSLRHKGVTAYELSVDTDNQSAIGFYEQLGFRQVGTYDEHGRGHHRYRLDLAPPATSCADPRLSTCSRSRGSSRPGPG